MKRVLLYMKIGQSVKENFANNYVKNNNIQN